MILGYVSKTIDRNFVLYVHVPGDRVKKKVSYSNWAEGV
nr:translation initiation factor 1 [Calophyllum inophyllum]UXW91127.1 translation initiation factor 1 [Calophyllum inophyllum]